MVFLNFANFYQCFTEDFNNIIRLLLLIFKTSFKIQLLSDLLLLIDENKCDEFGCNGDNNCKDETIEKVSLSKN